MRRWHKGQFSSVAKAALRFWCAKLSINLKRYLLLCLLCQNYQLLSHNFTTNLFAQITSRLCRGVQNAIMFRERQIIKFRFVMELHLWRFLTSLIRDRVIFELLMLLNPWSIFISFWTVCDIWTDFLKINRPKD